MEIPGAARICPDLCNNVFTGQFLFEIDSPIDFGYQINLTTFASLLLTHKEYKAVFLFSGENNFA